MPFLAPFVGPGRLFNFLIRNIWHSGEAIAQLGQLPVLLLSSTQVPPVACDLPLSRESLIPMTASSLVEVAVLCFLALTADDGCWLL